MSELSNFSEIELVKFINDLEKDHNDLKQEIVDLTDQYDELAKKINGKLLILTEIEENYKILIKEYENR